jgi:hypothetical protein
MQNALALSQTNSSSSEITTSLASIFQDYAQKLKGIKSIASFVSDKSELADYFLSGNKTSGFMAKEIFALEGAVRALDAQYWSKVIAVTDVLDCMPAVKRNEWNAMIHDMNTPPFIPENVILTVQGLLASRETFLADRVDGLFRNLSGNHLTNSPQGFCKRMIIEYVLDGYGYLNHQRVEYVHDLRAVIAKLAGRDQPDTTRADLAHIARSEYFGDWFDFDGGAFRVKLFKKGTAHMEIHPDTARQLNRILSTKYPQALAPNSLKKTAKAKEVPLQRTLIRPDVLKALVTVVDCLSRGRRECYVSRDDYSLSTLDGVTGILEFLGAVGEDGLWKFDYDASEVLSTIIRTGFIPEIKSHQYYPTKASLASRVIELAEITDDDLILEPSAGQGGLASFLPIAQTTCVEISEVNAKILKAKGHKVIVGDFLKATLEGGFSKIVMNPPFTKHQAEDHLKRAAELLKGGGKIVAILPGTLCGRELIAGYGHCWSELIDDAFDGTSVSVAILELTKPLD